MSVRVVFFASIREALGREVIELPASEGLRVSTLLEALAAALGDGVREILGAENVQVALNQSIVQADQAIKDGDEVAYLPPVTGG